MGPSPEGYGALMGIDLHALDLGVMASKWLKDLVEAEDSYAYLRTRYPDMTEEDFEAVYDKMREVADALAPAPDVGASAMGRLNRRWQERDRGPYDDSEVVGTL